MAYSKSIKIVWHWDLEGRLGKIVARLQCQELRYDSGRGVLYASVPARMSSTNLLRQLLFQHVASSGLPARFVYKSKSSRSCTAIRRKAGHCHGRLARSSLLPASQSQRHLLTLPSGIGTAIARNLASKGASLVLGYTSDSSSEPTANLADSLESSHGISSLTVQADMGHPNGPAHLISSAKNYFAHPRSGKFQIDIIINNAGVSRNVPLEEVDIQDFNHQYTVNVLGPILLLQAALPYLPTDRSGRIVNLSSVSSSLGFHGQTIYGGTKAALEAMTRTWARELGERATVNTVNPGPVATDMYESTSPEYQKQMKPFMQSAPLQKVRPGIDDEQLVRNAETAGGRPAYDHEIAGVVAMLCTEDSAWCTGSVVCANGGFRFSI